MKKTGVLLTLLAALLLSGCYYDIPGFTERREEFFDYVISQPPGNTYTQLVRVHRGVAPDESRIQADLDFINARNDCADFRVHSILRMLIQFGDSELLSSSILNNAKNTVLNFKYWPDEMQNEPVPGNTDDMCYWSENHFILFAAGAYLAAQLYPDGIFTASNETGSERLARFRNRIVRWLDLRYTTGFSEWLSNVYYDEDIAALVNLVDFCEDEVVANKAAMVLDLLLADMALNHFRGNFGSTHGRSYQKDKYSGTSDNTASTFKLLFDMCEYHAGNMSSTCLALSTKYRLPAVIYAMAVDTERANYENRQRMGVTMEEASTLWGLDYGSLEDGMTFLTMEAYLHPCTIELFKAMMDRYNWWTNAQFAPIAAYKAVFDNPALMGFPSLQIMAAYLDLDVTRNMRPQVNIYTYRTPHYMLSTAQDWRPGYGGDQQHIWQATLGRDAVCYTTHPANLGDDSMGTPNFWTGYGTLPRSIQARNVVISLYDIDTDDSNNLYIAGQPLYTHAFLPRGKFDEVDSTSHPDWIFARKGNGYLALRPAGSAPYIWVDHSDDAQKGGPYEIRVAGEKTAWICELGHRGARYRSFNAFKNTVRSAAVTVSLDPLSVVYVSPSQGTLALSWDGNVNPENPMTRNGTAVPVRYDKRYDNPYGSSYFPADKVSFKLDGYSLRLDYAAGTRKASGYLK